MNKHPARSAGTQHHTAMRSISKLILLLSITSALSVKAQTLPAKDDKAGFPKPTGIKNMLFYIQRTLNTNTIIYELNTDAAGELNAKEPVKLYYINYANRGETEAVSGIQKKYAYGFDIKLIDAEKKTYSFALNAFKSRTLYLTQSPKDKAFHVFCNIHNQLAMLSFVFVKMESDKIGFPHVRSIELIGKSVATGDDLSEVFKP